MRILLLAHSFNSLTSGSALSFASAATSYRSSSISTTPRRARRLSSFGPTSCSSFLKRAIPEDIWRRYRCLIVHPGMIGDRGPSALDWAILEGKKAWGVTVLQAEAEMDAGPVWAAAVFTMREASKSSLYRREVATRRHRRCWRQSIVSNEVTRRFAPSRATGA